MRPAGIGLQARGGAVLSGGDAEWRRGGGARTAGLTRGVMSKAAIVSAGAASVTITGRSGGSGEDTGASASPRLPLTITTSMVETLNAEPCTRCNGARIGSAACKPIAASRIAVHTRMRSRMERSNLTRAI